MKTPSSAGAQQVSGASNAGTMVMEKTMNIIEQIEKEEIARLTANKTIPAFAPGDTVIVNVNVVEGNRKRV